MMNRRYFIKQTSIMSAATLFAPTLLSCNDKKNTIGLQIYTLRDAIKEDLEGTLKKVADIGYNSIEAAGYADGRFYDKKPEEFKNLLNGMGMKLHSSHTSIFDTETAKQVAEAGAKAGLEYIICPWMPEEHRQSADTVLKLADSFNKIGEVCKQFNIDFGYHNHDFEFQKVSDKLIYDLLIENTEPDLVTFELDVFWIKKAGYDSVEYFKKFPGRFEILHLKDMADTQEKEFAPVGQGIIDFEAIFNHAEQAGMKYYFVEQDSFTKHTPFESIELSYKYLSER